MGICQSKTKSRTNEKEKREKGEKGEKAEKAEKAENIETTPNEGHITEVQTKKSINLKKLTSAQKIATFNEKHINTVTADAAEVASIAAVASPSVTASVDVPSQKKKKIIILNGPPGAGKDTQCNLLLAKFNFHLLVCSALLKNYLEKYKKEDEKGETKTECQLKEEEKILNDIKNSFADGSLVPDDTVIKIFTDELNYILSNDNNNNAEGILINGFPRTEQQALLFKKSNIPVDVLININVDKDILWLRLSSRVVDPETNMSYDANVIELIKKKKRGETLNEEELNTISVNENYEHINDQILNRLKRREDDEEAVFDKRYGLYKENEKKILSVFHDICKNVDGNKQPSEVFNEIIKIIEQI